MNQTTPIRALFEQPQQYFERNISLVGWIRNIRDQKNFTFISLNDGSCFKPLQLVVARENISNYEEITHYGHGSAIRVSGVLKATPAAKQAFELEVSTLALEGDCPAHYPLQPKRHSVEFLRSIAHLRPRTNLYAAIFRLRSEAAFAIHEFFHNRGFVYVHTPLITASDAEGAGEMFKVTCLDYAEFKRQNAPELDYSQDFFAKPSYLTVSGQLAGECFAQAFRNIYTFGPTFRAEKSNTARHAAEFWMVEPEIAFADLTDNMALAEAMLKFIVERLFQRCPAELDFFNEFVEPSLKERLQKLLAQEFGCLTYTKAIEILQKAPKKFEYPVHWGADLQTEHERYLAEEYCQGPVFIIDYPKEIKAFYMKLNPDGKTVAAMDLLVPGVGELIGGSQREEDAAKLRTRLSELGLPAEDYSWYLELREFGSTSHAGYGLGFERLLMYVSGISNIRDVIPFPRTCGSAEF